MHNCKRMRKKKTSRKKHENFFRKFVRFVQFDFRTSEFRVSYQNCSSLLKGPHAICSLYWKSFNYKRNYNKSTLWCTSPYLSYIHIHHWIMGCWLFYKPNEKSIYDIRHKRKWCCCVHHYSRICVSKHNFFFGCCAFLFFIFFFFHCKIEPSQASSFVDFVYQRSDLMRELKIMLLFC